MKTAEVIDSSLSLPHASTREQLAQQKQRGLYYNASYEIENFMQTYLDTGTESGNFKVLNDPTYNGFKMFFHFSDTIGLLADETNVNSALAYLKRIGDDKRYETLKRFILTLSKVSSSAPWIFQEITGIQELYTQPIGEPLRNHEISISTLETIDHKIMSLVQMYRHIAYDFDRYVYVLPENLREFTMSIYIYDFRNFDSTSETAIDFLQTIYNQDVRRLNHVLFELKNCQFDISSGGKFLESVKNSDSTPTDNNIDITVKRAGISYLFKTITEDLQLNDCQFELAKVSASNNTGLNISGHKPADTWSERTLERLSKTGLVQSAQRRLEEYRSLGNLDNLKGQLGTVIDEVQIRLEQRLEAELTRLYLGNVHGFSIGDITRLNEDKDFRTAFNKIYSNKSNTTSLKFGNTTRQTLGNINM